MTIENKTKVEINKIKNQKSKIIWYRRKASSVVEPDPNPDTLGFGSKRIVKIIMFPSLELT
jgi:hypothetical protein